MVIQQLLPPHGALQGWCMTASGDLVGGGGAVLLVTRERPCTMYRQHKVNYLHVRAFTNVIMLHFLLWVEAFCQYISCFPVLCPFIISELRLED